MSAMQDVVLSNGLKVYIETLSRDEIKDEGDRSVVARVYVPYEYSYQQLNLMCELFGECDVWNHHFNDFLPGAQSDFSYKPDSSDAEYCGGREEYKKGKSFGADYCRVFRVRMPLSDPALFQPYSFIVAALKHNVERNQELKQIGAPAHYIYKLQYGNISTLVKFNAEYEFNHPMYGNNTFPYDNKWKVKIRVDVLDTKYLNDGLYYVNEIIKHFGFKDWEESFNYNTFSKLADDIQSLKGEVAIIQNTLRSILARSFQYNVQLVDYKYPDKEDVYDIVKDIKVKVKRSFRYDVSHNAVMVHYIYYFPLDKRGLLPKELIQKRRGGMSIEIDGYEHIVDRKIASLGTIENGYLKIETDKEALWDKSTYDKYIWGEQVQIDPYKFFSEADSHSKQFLDWDMQAMIREAQENVAKEEKLRGER